MLTRIFLNMLNRKAASPKNKPDEILEKLAVGKGKTIADIGAGGGYFSLAFARQVDQEGTVYAVDSNPDHLRFIREKAEKLGLDMVQTLPAATNGANPLPKMAVDLIFARNVFHHLDAPEQFFRTLKSSLAADGKVAIIEYLPAKKFNYVSLFKHCTPLGKLQAAMEAAGYKLQQAYDFLPDQSFTLWSPQNTSTSSSE